MERDLDDPEKTVAEALKRAGVYEKVMSLPHGIHTVLTREFDDSGAVLSGGEYQKIVVARAFANPAPIKVFDEPSSALDPIAEYNLFQEELMEQGGKYAAMYKMQAKNYQPEETDLEVEWDAIG